MRGAIATLSCALAIACAGEPSDAENPPGAATVARASLLLEPPTIGLGDVTTAVVLVTTPPGHRVLPLANPEVPGVWVLQSLVDPTEKSPARWLHRTRIRLRPRETGNYLFPASQVTIESESGDRKTLDVAEREFHVASVLPQFAERTAPFGLQELGPGSGSGGFLLPALLGAAAALLAVALVSRFRLRGLAQPEEDEAERAEDLSLHDWSQREIERAFERLEENPREAANIAARFMRQYVESRFRTRTSASSTEELAAQKPPLAAHSHWPEFVRLLRSMDDLRWKRRSAGATSQEEARARAALEEAQRFLESSSQQRARS
jgi:hypothetical protein